MEIGDNQKTIVCAECGQELPLNKYNHWRNIDGTICYTKVCRKCYYLKYKNDRKKEYKNKNLTSYSDEELIGELIRRNIWKKIENILGNSD